MIEEEIREKDRFDGVVLLALKIEEGAISQGTRAP